MIVLSSGRGNIGYVHASRNNVEHWMPKLMNCSRVWVSYSAPVLSWDHGIMMLSFGRIWKDRQSLISQFCDVETWTPFLSP